MSTADSVTDRISNLVGDLLFIDPPAPEDDLIEAGLIDSLAVVTLIDGIEAEFETRLPLDEFEIDDFRSVGRIAD